jgi:hypothetical protein
MLATLCVLVKHLKIVKMNVAIVKASIISCEKTLLIAADKLNWCVRSKVLVVLHLLALHFRVETL